MAKFYADEHRASKSKRERERESNSSAAAQQQRLGPPFPAPFMETVDLSTCGCLRQRGGKESWEGRERTDGAA